MRYQIKNNNKKAARSWRYRQIFFLLFSVLDDNVSIARARDLLTSQGWHIWFRLMWGIRSCGTDQYPRQQQQRQQRRCSAVAWIMEISHTHYNILLPDYTRVIMRVRALRAQTTSSIVVWSQYVIKAMPCTAVACCVFTGAFRRKAELCCAAPGTWEFLWYARFIMAGLIPWRWWWRHVYLVFVVFIRMLVSRALWFLGNVNIIVFQFLCSPVPCWRALSMYVHPWPNLVVSWLGIFWIKMYRRININRKTLCLFIFLLKNIVIITIIIIKMLLSFCMIWQLKAEAYTVHAQHPRAVWLCIRKWRVIAGSTTVLLFVIIL